MLLNRHVQMLGLVAVAAVASAQEQAAAATLEITATVPNACTVQSGSVAFGTYVSGQQSSLDATGGGFSVECSSGAEVEISLDGGLHEGSGGNGRAMSSPTSGDFLNYHLYRGPGFSTQWDPSLLLPFTLINGSNPIEVNGLISADQSIGGGEYSDTVQITLTFN
jgi:spore coat protein U-like protein